MIDKNIIGNGKIFIRKIEINNRYFEKGLNEDNKMIGRKRE